ncbi:MAG: DNA primase [Lachnospiraceae bacterium]|nr:DNA primase [Lachnospiraceae bacterium]
MRYPDEVVEEVLSRTNLVDVVGQEVSLKKSGNNYMGLCPFHNEKTPSFHVDANKQLYYCFGCHAGGSAITFMMQYYHMTFQEALQALADRAGVVLPEVRQTPEMKAKADRKTQLLAIQKKAATWFYKQLKTPAGAHGYTYLKKRGLTDATILHFGLGYSTSNRELYSLLKKDGYSDDLLKASGLFVYDDRKGVMNKFWNRVMYPIMDERGRVIGFGGRVMGDGKPKYLNSPETELFNKRLHLYALQYARTTKKNYMILCEGYMDVITMHQAGFTNAVASLGTALTEQQATLLRRFTKEVLLLYDSDGAGTLAALRAAPILREAGISSRVVRLEPHKDPDEFIKAEGAEAFQDRLDHALNSFLFMLDEEMKKYRQDEPDERTAFQRDCAERLLIFHEPLERANYIQAVADRYGFPVQELTRLVNQLAALGTPAAAYRKPKPGREEEPGNRGEVKAEELFLSYLVRDPGAFASISPLLGPDDLGDPFCRNLAEILWKSLEKGRVDEKMVISNFEEAENQRRCQEIFHADLPLKSQDEIDKAFTDVTVSIMSRANNRKMKNLAKENMNEFASLITRRRLIEEYKTGKKRLHLHLKEESPA